MPVLRSTNKPGLNRIEMDITSEMNQIRIIGNQNMPGLPLKQGAGSSLLFVNCLYVSIEQNLYPLS